MAILSAVLSCTCCKTDKPPFAFDFNHDVIGSGEWVCAADPDTCVIMEYLPCSGLDSSGCIRICSQSRTDAYASTEIRGLDPGRIYRMRAHIATRNVSEGRGANIYVRTSDGRQSWNASEFQYGDNEWKEVYVDFLPSGDGTACLTCRLGFFEGTYNGGKAMGEALFDNIRVEEVSGEEMYFRSGKHVLLALDRDKVKIPDAEMDSWIEDLDRVYEAYVEFTGHIPLSGDKIVIMTTPGIEPGYWALAGNPILWNNHVGIESLLEKTAGEGDWNFGILHEIAHIFSGDELSRFDSWNWNEEVFANLRMSYALEVCGGRVSQRGVTYEGAGIMEYYKIFYDQSLGRGEAGANGDAIHYTLLRIKEKYGWDIFGKAFRNALNAPRESAGAKYSAYDKFLNFISYLSEAAGEDVSLTCYTPVELDLIKQSLEQMP